MMVKYFHLGLVFGMVNDDVVSLIYGCHMINLVNAFQFDEQ